MENPVTSVDLILHDESLSEEQAQSIVTMIWDRAVGLVRPLADHTPSTVEAAAIRSVILTASLRRAEVGAGGIRARGAGDYSEQFQVSDRPGLFLDDELKLLRQCVGIRSRGGFSIDTAPSGAGVSSRTPFNVA